MSTVNVRQTQGPVTVLTLAAMYDKPNNTGRSCPICHVSWTCERDAQENFHVWRNGLPMDAAILDWRGNNVSVECCHAQE